MVTTAWRKTIAWNNGINLSAITPYCYYSSWGSWSCSIMRSIPTDHPRKPMTLWLPSQKGLFWEAPHRQSTVFAFFSIRPSVCFSTQGPVMINGPLGETFMINSGVSVKAVFKGVGSSNVAILNAPLGHFRTCSMIRSSLLPSIFTQGLTRGLNTSPKPFQQMVEWLQSFGCHTTVVFPLVYLMISLGIEMVLS